LSEPAFPIVAWGEDDLPLLHRLLGDPAMTDHLGGPESPEKIEDRHTRYLDGKTGAVEMFKVVETATGESVGSVGYWERESHEGQVYETGWMVLPEFQGRGIATVATAVLFSSAFPAMFGTFVKYQFQRTYDAILAAPVDTEELVSAEAIWIATRAGVYGCVPMLVGILFGLDPSWGMFAVPFIAWLSGFGWACFGIMVAGFAKSFENFNYIVSAVLTPLFLVAGTFFPIDGLPDWAQFLANFNPLHQCVVLVRHAVFGFEGPAELWRVGLLVGFGLLMWRIAIRAMTRKLID
jgi:lipooligosaccharide transport system permease protein